MRTRAVLASICLVVLAACTGGGGGGDGDGASEAELTKRLETARTSIADAEALDIELSTKSLPAGVSGLKTADGRGYQGDTPEQAAFEGKVTVSLAGSSIGAEVVAVDGEVYAKTDLAPQFLGVDPETLRAPDPAGLIGAKDGGLPSILVKTEGLKEGKETRDGKDVLTSITGTLPGEVIAGFLPTADESQDFAVTYRLTDDDELRDATIKGPFYGDSGDVTYRITLAASDDTSKITKP